MQLLSVDLGTSSIKAGVFDTAGRELALLDREVLTLPEGLERAEFDAEEYWLRTAGVIREAIALAGVPAGDIAAVSISSHGESLFLTDEDGRPVRKAILTLDARATEEAAALAAAPGRAAIYEITGQPDILPIWPAAKILWLSKHEPDMLRRARRFLLPQGYIAGRLCGRAADDPSVLATSLLYDIWQQKWSPRLLAAVGVEEDRLAEVVPAGAVVGAVTPRAAKVTRLAPGTRVVTGALDQVCAAIAAGNLAPGALTESTGSVIALVATAPEQSGWRDAIQRSGIPIYPHALPGRYCLLPWHQTGGLALKWFRDRFAQGAGGDDFADLTGMAAAISPGAEGLIALPHFEGAQFPESVPAARAVFFGVSLCHTRAHFVRAILEGTACLIARDIAALRQAGIPVEELVSLGGGARSELWLQIKADVTGLPVRTLETKQSALLGAAILAAVGSGCYPDLPSAVRTMARPGRLLEPDVAKRAVYDETLRTFALLHERLLDLFGEDATPR